MRIHQTLSSLLVAASLVGAPIIATAEPVPVTVSAPANGPKPATAEDAAHYAQAEQKSSAAAKFEGGDRGIYIGGGVLTVLLIVLLIVIII